MRVLSKIVLLFFISVKLTVAFASHGCHSGEFVSNSHKEVSRQDRVRGTNFCHQPVLATKVAEEMAAVLASNQAVPAPANEAGAEHCKCACHTFALESDFSAHWQRLAVVKKKLLPLNEVLVLNWHEPPLRPPRYLKLS